MSVFDRFRRPFDRFRRPPHVCPPPPQPRLIGMLDIEATLEDDRPDFFITLDVRRVDAVQGRLVIIGQLQGVSVTLPAGPYLYRFRGTDRSEIVRGRDYFPATRVVISSDVLQLSLPMTLLPAGEVSV